LLFLIQSSLFSLGRVPEPPDDEDIHHNQLVEMARVATDERERLSERELEMQREETRLSAVQFDSEMVRIRSVSTGERCTIVVSEDGKPFFFGTLTDFHNTKFGFHGDHHHGPNCHSHHHGPNWAPVAIPLPGTTKVTDCWFGGSFGWFRTKTGKMKSFGFGDTGELDRAAVEPSFYRSQKTGVYDQPSLTNMIVPAPTVNFPFRGSDVKVSAFGTTHCLFTVKAARRGRQSLRGTQVWALGNNRSGQLGLESTVTASATALQVDFF
jgi:alpha-tubulin suppressor-like RCC1 family protein